MKFSARVALLVVAVLFAAMEMRAQESSAVRPRVVTPMNQEQQTAPVTSSKIPPANPATVGPTLPVIEADPQKRISEPIAHLTPSVIQARISEAQRMFKTRPKPTALVPSIEFVTVAALDRETGRTHFITLSKETFLTKGAEANTITSEGTQINLRIIRANGVNTAMTIFTPEGKALAPLTIEYPIERGGKFLETAYYTSAHPALLSKDLSRSGQSYVRNMLDLAARRLREKGLAISPQLVDVAERLCVVEHVDHDRFRAENRLALYDEIYSLFALNQIDTYRYSVSSAGAGGMVQMIPWAYNLERTRHPGVGLIPDFVTGMRNHGNALQAMLLYMHDTWNELTANDEVKYALGAKIATPSELLAAGYNSNAAKLPGYLKRGGDGWRVLIPRETQMYLQIYKSFEGLVPMQNRATDPR
ncbi:MAG TPA: hypothetical protein VGQ41_20170 [Pyrinomonadaceae bacterium]|jgi:hypothetical protein|nr:hypothetical protein [Pyrinomonadaceae bacterium]